MVGDEDGAKGFLRSLYDFSFTTFVTTRIVRTLYIVTTIVYSLVAIVVFVGLVSRGGADVAIGVIGVPIAYVLYLALARVSLEVVAVVFRIAEYAREIRDQGRAIATDSGEQMPGTEPGGA
ncbi:MAG: DUF4282 domain-containing protein [Actinomycetota bacterium]|nr:DUF4282 domain-containing protein [Actinomycetota bacterium]